MGIKSKQEVKEELEMEKNKNYESVKLYNGLKMTLDNDKNCIILRTRKKLKDVDPALIFHLANSFIEEIECNQIR